MRTLVLFIAAFLIATAAPAQTAPPPDPNALQALLNEVHQLRVDIQNVALTMQRVQIILYRLQSQTALASRAASQLDNVRAQLGGTQSEKKSLANRIQQMEESLRDTQNPQELRDGQGALREMKIQFERLNAEEQRLQAREIDLDSQARAEQSKLSELQDQIDRLDKVLDGFGRK
jgi:chromosome segregation ATPase